MNWIFFISLISGFVILLLTFTKGKRALRYLFYFWVLCFSFGPRSITAFDIKFFFIEGITLFVFFALLFRLNNFIKEINEIFPKYTMPMFLWFIVGYLVALNYGRDWVIIFDEFKIFFYIPPVFYITYVGIKYLRIELSKVVGIYLLGTVILSLGSIIPYYFHELAVFLARKLITGDSILIDIGILNMPQRYDLVFRRGTGSFWGTLLLSAYLLLLLFAIYTRKDYIKNEIKKIAYITACIFSSIVIITNGHRSVWVGFLFGLAFISLMKGVKGIFYGTVAFTAFIILLPPDVIARFLTIFEVSDMSWMGRVTRYKYALQIIWYHPLFGLGFGGAGWVHNAILQIGANLGLIGLSLFLLWNANISFRSIYVYREFSKKTYLKGYHLGFLTSIVAFWGPLLGESTINHVTLMIPFWFFCAVLQNFNNGNILNSIEE